VAQYACLDGQGGAGPELCVVRKQPEAVAAGHRATCAHQSPTPLPPVLDTDQWPSLSAAAIKKTAATGDRQLEQAPKHRMVHAGDCARKAAKLIYAVQHLGSPASTGTSGGLARDNSLAAMHCRVESFVIALNEAVEDGSAWDKNRLRDDIYLQHHVVNSFGAKGSSIRRRFIENGSGYPQLAEAEMRLYLWERCRDTQNLAYCVNSNHNYWLEWLLDDFRRLWDGADARSVKACFPLACRALHLISFED